MDVEAADRGYLLSGEDRYLAALRRDRAAWPAETLKLRRLVRDNPPQERAAVAIERAVGAYVDGTVGPLAAAPADRSAARRRRLAGDLGGGGVEALTRRFDRFAAVERRLAGERRARAERGARRAVIVGAGGLAGLVALVLLFVLATARSIVLPVRRVVEAARGLSAGRLSTRVPEDGSAEIGELGRAFNAMAASIHENHDEVETQHAELERQQIELETQNAELERQQAELEEALDGLAREKSYVEGFHRFGEVLAAETELGPLARTILRHLCHFAVAEVGSVYVVNDARGEAMTNAAACGVLQDVPLELPQDGGPAARAVAERRTVAVAGADTVLRAVALGEEARARHELHLPLVHGDRTLGVVTAARLGDRPFEPAEIDVLEYLAGQAAVAVSNVLSLHRAKRQATINRAVLETANEAFVSIDEQGVVTGWNPEAEAVFGWPAAEAIGRTLGETIVPPGLRAAHERGLRRFLETGEGELTGRRIELCARHRDGRDFPIELTISPLRLDDRWQFNAFVRDISERKRSELFVSAQLLVTGILAESPTLDAARSRILGELGPRMGWEVAAAWRAEQGCLRCVEVWHEPGVDTRAFEERTRDLRLERGEGLPGRAWAAGRPLFVEDLAAEPGVPQAEAAARAGLRGAICMPIGERDPHARGHRVPELRAAAGG